MSTLDRVASLLRSHVPAGTRLLVAVSGGPDSVALLHVLKGLPYPIVVGHVDHALRKGSAQDAQFVRRLARDWDLPCQVKREQVKVYARTHQLGLEEAAREVRYRALSAMALRTRCAAIVTAHTADDQSETVLMNFLRGAGGAGLSGMPVARSLNHGSDLILVRPFLGLAKKELLVYLRAHALPFRTDPTNTSLRFTRNRIRHTVLPYLEKLHPGLGERLAQGADLFRQEEDFWAAQVAKEMRKTVRKKGKTFTVVLPRLLGYHRALGRRILRRILPGLSFQDIEQVFQLARSPGEAGALELPGSWQVRRRKDRMVISQQRSG